jgi:hypothetical protein
MVERAAATAGMELKAHPHMLRHACGYALANKGHDTRGHPGLARPSVDHEHRGLHRLGAEPLQGLLAGLMQSLGALRSRSAEGDSYSGGGSGTPP